MVMERLTFKKCDECKNSYHDANGNILCNKWNYGEKIPEFISYNENSVYCHAYATKTN